VSRIPDNPSGSNTSAKETTYAEQLTRFFDCCYSPGGVIELRAPKMIDGTRFGFFSDHVRLANVALSLSGGAPGIYTTVNCVAEDLLARCDNHTKIQMGAVGTAKDEDIQFLTTLFIDADAIRAKDTSATDAEHTAAIQRAWDIQGYLKESFGWGDPVMVDSGNGGHLRYSICLPNTKEHVDLMRGVLHALAAKFNDNLVKVDTITFNPSRVAKVPFTLAAKGVATTERPHRMSRIVSMPPLIEAVTRDQIVDFWMYAEPSWQQGAREPPRAAPRASQGSTNGARANGAGQAQGFGLLEKALQQDAKLASLYAGDTGGYESHSNADEALCCKLIFWFGPDAGLVDYLFRQSGLYRPKWDERRSQGTYGSITIADALLLQTEYYDPLRKERRERRQQEPEPPEPPKPQPDAKVYTWRDVPCVFDLEARVSWLIEDLVPEAAVTLLTGDSGHGKTILATALAGHIVAGLPFLGFGVQQRKVLYMDRENPLGVVKQHLYDLHIKRTSDLIIWGGWCERIPDTPSAPSLIEFARDEHPVIIFDSLIAFHTGDEQSATDTRKYLQHYRQLAAEGATIIVLHHTGKSEGAKQYRGSSDIKASVDVAWLLEKLGDAADLLKELRLVGFKNRMGGGRTIPLSFSDGRFSSAYERSESDEEKLERVVRRNPGEAQRALIELGKMVGLSKHRVEDLLREGVESGKYEIRKLGHNRFGYFFKEPDLGL
jgi:AAA domain